MLFILLSSIRLCHAQAGYLRDEITGNPIDSTAKKVIILIHGWNPDNVSDMYAADPWASLISDTKQRLSGFDWKLFTFHWEQGTLGANTGPAYTYTIQDGFVGVGNSVVAAVHADQQGHDLASLLNQSAPNLRRVQLIAHSAGAWVAREAAADILQSNPYVTVQVTLLDPFIPDVIPEQSTGLNDSYMNQMASVTGNDRISLLENYYADDITFLPTQQTFMWRSSDINQRVDWPVSTPIYYDSHGGPIQFFADTVYVSIAGNSTPSGLYGLGCPFDYSQVGWIRSLFYTDELRSPGIAVQPQNQSASIGSTVTLSVTASSSHPLSYQWFLNGQSVGGATSASYSFTQSPTSGGAYVVKISYQDQNGFTFSDPATVSIVASAGPTISTVSPAAFTGLPVGQRTPIRIIGAGFTSGSTLVFNDGLQNYNSNPTYLTFISANEIDYNISTGTNQANWTVQVVNGAQTSGLGHFTVNAPSAPPTTTGSLVVNLSPAGAVSAGAQWQVDGGTYYSSGGVVPVLTPGSHTVSFKPISGYTTPANQNVTINANAQTTASGTYSVIAPSTYTLTLNQGGSAGYIVNQPFGSGSGNTYNAGAVVQLTANANFGYHFANWSGDVSGTANPTTITMNENKTVGAVFAAGDPNLGTITVTILPPEAAAAGVTWGFNDTDFRASGNSYSYYPETVWVEIHNTNGWVGYGGWVTFTAGVATNYTFACSSTAGTIIGSDPRTYYTLAGSPTNSGSLDGIGNAALFSRLWGVAVDKTGNIFVADTFNELIRKVSPLGVVTTIAGQTGVSGYADGQGTNASFSQPVAIAVDSSDNLYVADFFTSIIRKINTNGVVSTLAGLANNNGSVDANGSSARFYFPAGVAVDTNGNVYVSDSVNETIRKITPNGDVSTLAGLARSYGTADGTGSSARFHNPSGMAVDNSGNVYVADEASATVRKVTAGGVVTTLAGYPGSAGTADGTGNAARFQYLNDVAVDTSGNVYVADAGNHAIRKITPSGVVTTLAGQSGNPGIADGIGSVARFDNPGAIAVDSSGNLYIGDTLNYTIRATQPLTTRVNQSIAFPTIPEHSAGDNPFTITATASSGLPVYFDVISGPAVLDTNNNLTLLGGGTVTIAAWQPGDSNYNPAQLVQQSFNVTKVPQTITFGSLSQQKVGDAPFPLTATTDSGLLVSYSASGPATLSGNILILTGWGTVTVTASQPGNNTYAAATNAVQSFFVVPPDNTIVSPQRLSNGNFQLAFYGLAGTNYLIQTSTNLVNWQPFTNFTGSNLIFYLNDSGATNFKQRFYRVTP